MKTKLKAPMANGLYVTICAALLALPGTQVRAAERQTIHYRRPSAVTNSPPVALSVGWKRLNLALGLPLRNEAALDAFLRELNDPAGPNYRHYLTPEQFTERFGPTEQDYEALIRFVQSHGLSVTARHPNRLVLDVKGMVPQIERTFHVKLRVYQHPTEARTFYAPDQEPAIDLDVPVLSVSGLDDFTMPHPMSLKKTALSQVKEAGTGSGPSGTFMGYDFRAAYVPGAALTGTGQTVGLLEFDSGYYASDITKYEHQAGLPNVPVQAVLLDGYNGGAGDGNDEVSLDIEMAISMAPGLSGVLVYEGSVTDDILNRMATDNLAKQIGASWTYAIDATSDQIFKELAAQGQSFYNASGDSDAYTGAIPTPSDDTNIICVGGTTLTTSGPGGSWVSEKVWNWGDGTGSSGGISTRNAIPIWQQGISMSANQGSTTMRNIPDVALTADNVYVTYGNGASGSFGGTSCATPLWAAFTALANQLALASGEPVLGFVNPAVYAIGKGSNFMSYTTLFHDITTGNNESPSSPAKFSAVPGYDLCTGWGTPYGSNLLTALAIPEPLRITPAGGVIISGPAGGPFTPPTQSFSLTNTGPGPVSWELVNTSAWFKLAPGSGTLTRGGPAATVVVSLTAAASNLVAGSYSATVQFTNLSDHFGQNRTLTLAVVTPPVITSQPANQAVLQGATATFNVGTAPDALLFYQWQKSGSNLSDGGGVLGSTTSTLTISSAAPANVGSYSVIVSNVTGVQVSSNALLTIVPSAPVITVQPTNQVVLPGASATFTVAAIGDQPFSYQWRLNGTNLANGSNLSGATTNVLTLNSVWTTNTGTYSVRLSNDLGAVYSTGAVLALVPVSVSGLALNTLYSFPTNDLAGDSPYGPLARGRDGRLYGTTLEGGTNSYGTVFRISTNGAFNTLFSFNYTDGGFIYAGLALGTDGAFYGAAFEGGANGDGTVFRVTTNGALTTLFAYNEGNGELPVAGLTLGSDGYFYGTTLEGGAYGYGTVFKTTSGGARTTLVSFDYSDGAYPSAVLAQGADGNFYGTTENGGTNGGAGTVFRITPAGVLTTLYSFSGGNDGAGPIPGLAQGTDGNFYGTTIDGGSNGGFGTVFEITAAGVFTSLYSFTGTSDGANPWGGLVQSTDGNLYGTTQGGGAYGDGTVFRIAPNGPLTTVATFDGYEGAAPSATLTQGADGNLYGTTAGGGAGSYGTVFQLSINGPLQITSQPQDQAVFLGGTALFNVATFGGLPVTYRWQQGGVNLTDGANISGSATATLRITNVTAANASLYSVIVSNAYGAVASDAAFLEVLVSPPQITGQPASQTLLAGETATFSVQATGDVPLSYQWLENGTTLTDGGQISGSATSTLTIGNLTTANAGAYSVIVRNSITSVPSAPASLAVFPVSPPFAALTTAHLFTDGSDGAFPSAGLMQAKDGYLYGTASGGGTDYSGAIFRMAPGGATVTPLYSFTDGDDGANPVAGLAQGANGFLYGTALNGGTNYYGTIFRIASGGTSVSPLYSFTDGNDGAYPYAGLLSAADGNFYGTASQGGTNGYGSIFKMTANGVVTPLYSFTGGNDGAYPYAGLVQGANGNLYGTTAEGGASGDGTVFEWATNGALTVLVSFNGTNGANPSAALVEGANGNLYGTTAEGGASGDGTVFEWATNGALTVLVSFNGTNGANPAAALVQGTDGNLYGTTATGGLGNYGTVFELTTNGALTTLAWFDGLNGAYPEATLVQATDGSFYGTTVYGGTGFNGTAMSGQGTIFKLTVPAFESNPFTMPAVTAGLPYSTSLSGKATAPPGDTFTFSLLNGPAWLSVAPNGALSGTPAKSNVGTNAFVVRLTDANGWSGSATLLVPVLAAVAPSFTSNPFTVPPVNVGQPYSGTIAGNATDLNIGDALTFALVTGPAWLNVATNGSLSGTPPNPAIGANAFLVSVTDLLELSNTATMYLQVYGPPAFTNNPFNAPFGAVGVAYSASIAASATDPNAGHAITFALVSGPSWLAVATNGTLSGTPAAANAGANTFVVSATDSSGLSASATMSLYVYTTPSFIVRPFSEPSGVVGVPYFGTIATNAAADPDAGIADTLTFIKRSGPAWLNVATNGLLSGTPSSADVGSPMYVVSVEDSVGLFSTTLMRITVNTDSPPYFLTNFLAKPDAKSAVPYSGTIATNATDPDLAAGDTLTFAKVSGPAWLTISNNGALVGTPGAADAGTNAFVVSVTDYDGLSNSATMWVNVEGPPFFTSNVFNLPWANVDQPYAETIAANALEPVAGATLIFSKLSGPAWLSVAANGAISGTPELTDAATNAFVVAVTDYRGLTNSAMMYVYVNSPPAFQPGQFTKPAATVGLPYAGTIATNATDPDLAAGDTLTFYKVTGPGWLGVAANGLLSGTPANADLGPGTFLLLAVDSGGLTSIGTMNIAVNTNSPPVFTANPFTLPRAHAGQHYSATISTNATDPNFGDTMTFAVVSGPAWLAVAPNGALSGTPANSDAGTNTFQVSATDFGGLSSRATMYIDVVGPIQLGIAQSGGNITLNWTGGSPPYQVQMSTNLAGLVWSNLGNPVSTTALTLTSSNAAAWFRVQGY